MLAQASGSSMLSLHTFPLGASMAESVALPRSFRALIALWCLRQPQEMENPCTGLLSSRHPYSSCGGVVITSTSGPAAA